MSDNAQQPLESNHTNYVEDTSPVESSNATQEPSATNQEAIFEKILNEEKVDTPNEGVGDNAQIQKYEEEIAQLNDKLLRVAAEVQNTRRMADIDIQKAKQFSTQAFAKDLLSVMDNLFLASDSVSEEEAAQDNKLKSLRDGVEITKREMLNVFQRNGIVLVNPAVGDAFDPEVHQAVSQIESNDVAPNAIIQVMQTGYKLKERLLRPAMVIVAKAAEKTE